ncbi:MAG TPA: serine hydrolase [Candidatus Saccharimonadales bacterium]|nr:serine hydrolase [Candidatus Saccharimonadales bacterium]
MTTAPAHIQQPIITNQVVSPADIQQLSRDDVGQAFKNILLRNYVDRIIAKNENLKVTTDVSIIDMQTQQSVVSHNLDTEQFAASVNKVPVADLVLADLRSGKLQMNQQLTWAASDVRAGEGVYDQPGAPLQASLQDVLFDMLNRSGNTAVRILVNKTLGGAAAVNTRITSDLHLQHTYLQPLDSDRFYLGNSTARDSLSALQQLLATNDTYGAYVKNALVTNIYTNYGVKSQLAGNDYIVLANKIGILDDPDGNNRHDVGLIYNTRTHKTYGYSFMTTAPGENWETPTAQAGASLADMGQAVLRTAGDKATGEQMQPKTLATPHADHRIKY